ncbi:uncharacterized protein LOC119982716 isoform X5 [Tripterygium wilfordii]|uniref:uncharacterized protein LOC119982716 isoform X5 n=1 Tax=Tripterygium wilfordii TaxID=458696 RepID=UPI0018F80D90|nr:uncharacterized protein LOC119982716 isoform X5 [Tripterygium wilfordii]
MSIWPRLNRLNYRTAATELQPWNIQVKQGDANSNLAGMTTFQNTQEIQSSTEVSHESQSEQQNNHSEEPPLADSGSVSASSNDNRKVSHQDIEIVQNLIERCLQLYMNRDEVVKTLLTRARIDPGFTTLVNNMPMGYPVLRQPPIPAPGQPHIDSTSCEISSCHVVNGVPAPGNFQPIRMNSENEMMMDTSAAEIAPVISPSNVMSEMSVSPTSAASGGHFPFTASDMSGMRVDTSALDTIFTSDVASSVGLQLGPDGGAGNSRDFLRSLDQIQWNFSLSDLTADLSNLGYLEALGNDPGSPFLPSDSEILLDSPEPDDIVEEFFVDSVAGPCSQSDEEAS